MKQSERTAPESRIREIRSYGLNEGERETVIAQAVSEVLCLGSISSGDFFTTS